MSLVRQVSLLLFLATLCHKGSCSEDRQHGNRRQEQTRDLLFLQEEEQKQGRVLSFENCSDPEASKEPECLCRHRSNMGRKVCQEWLLNLKKTPKSETSPAIEAVDVDGAGKIIGGTEVAAGAYPWFAKAMSGSSFWGGCGGMLVAPQYVLTAAHCVGGFNGFEIGALCHSSSGASNGNCGQASEVISASNIIKHPNYNSNTEDNDYALVKLQRSTSVTPVAMDSTGLSRTYGSGKSLWTIGFGNTSTSGDAYPTRLRHVEIKYVTDSTCNNKYGGDITSNMMCAADPGQDSCQGDSGGPLYDAENGVLVGIVSWGYNCADPNYPGVYARISEKWSWIQGIICGDNNSVKPSFCNSNPPPTPTPPTPTPPTPTPPSPTPPTPTPPSPTPPTPTPPSDTCSDDPENWVDAVGDGCSWYEAGSGRCEADGWNYAGTQGKTANEACCVCGGGSYGQQCTNSPTNWVDADGFGCGWYSIGNNCATDGDFFAGTEGKTANEACCICGGGAVSDNNTCQDVDTKFANEGRNRTCKWVGNNAQQRCQSTAAKQNCPVTCQQNCTCFDTAGNFLVNGRTRSCSWASVNPSVRCRNNKVRSNCPIACGVC